MDNGDFKHVDILTNNSDSLSANTKDGSTVHIRQNTGETVNHIDLSTDEIYNIAQFVNGIEENSSNLDIDGWSVDGITHMSDLNGLPSHIQELYETEKYVTFTNDERILLVPESEVQP